MFKKLAPRIITAPINTKIWIGSSKNNTPTAVAIGSLTKSIG
jgi:hypothetical protein